MLDGWDSSTPPQTQKFSLRAFGPRVDFHPFDQRTLTKVPRVVFEVIPQLAFSSTNLADLGQCPTLQFNSALFSHHEVFP